MENKKQNHIQLKTQADAILYFLQRMDIDMINDILDDNRTYQDFQKHIFIQKLGNALDQFIESGDTCLKYYKGSCNSELCNYMCSGFSFIGNKSKNYMDLIIDIKEGTVQDIYECSEFKNLKRGIQKKNRIEINQFEL